MEEPAATSAISDVRCPSPPLGIFQGLARANPNILKSRNARLLCVAFAAWLIANGAAPAQPVNFAASDPTGEWLVAKQVARIKIADCDGRMWGVVAWEAQPGVDTQKSGSQSANAADPGNADPARHGAKPTEQMGRADL